MKADPARQSQLLDLQTIDTRLSQIDHARRTLPQHAEIADLEGKARLLDDQLVRDSHALWQDEIAYARQVLERTDLGTMVDVHGEPTEVRDVVVHMIEEYARHCGHADLVRECIDGRAGQ